MNLYIQHKPNSNTIDFFLLETDKTDSKSYMEMQRDHISQNNFGKEQQNWRNYTATFKTFYNATLIAWLNCLSTNVYAEIEDSCPRNDS